MVSDKQKKVEETLKHWGYGSGTEQTAISAKGTALTLDNLTSPKDYLTDRLKAFENEIVPYLLARMEGLTSGKQRDIGKVKSFLTETIQQSMEVGREEGVRETEKAFGGCTKCYGKGYSTHMGSEEAEHTPIPLIDYCECGRGQQLKSLSPKP